MKFLALFIFCGSVQSVPVIGQPDSPLFGLEDNIENEDDAHYYLEKESAPNQCSNLLESEDSFEQPSRLSLPTLMTLSNEDAPQNPDVDEIVSDMIYPPMKVMLPTEFGAKELLPPMQLMRANPPLWSRWMNDMTYMQDPILENSNGSPYQFPPYMSENIVPSVRSLPPVSMQIHESLMEMHNYEPDDDLDMENGLYLTPNVRAVRSREEEFLKQLQHDAMIPNIIPTMPVPFVRSGGSPEYSQDTPLVMVIYPGRVTDCALPFLFSCSPKVAYGRLAQTPYSSYPSIPSSAPNSEYDKEADTVKSDEVNQVIEANIS